jgi:hypothetical protein
MPAVVAPDDDDGVIREPRSLQGREHPADLGIHKARAGKVTPHQISPLSGLMEPGESRFGQGPVQVPGKPRCVCSVIGLQRREHRVIIRVEIEPLLGCVAGYMRQEEAGCQEEGPPFRLFAEAIDLFHSPAGDLIVPLARVIVVQRPDAPVDERMIAHRCRWHELVGRLGPHTAIRGRGCKLWFFILAQGRLPPPTGSCTTVIDLPSCRRLVSMGGEVLRQGDPICEVRQRPKPGGQTVDAGRGGP